MAVRSKGSAAVALLVAALALSGPVAADVGPVAPGTAEAPDASRRFPPAGSYALPPIARVGEHWLLDVHGERVPLLGLEPGQVSVVALVYATCPSVCPAALSVLAEVDREVADEPALREHVRLVTVSFDPERDRPEQMAALRERFSPRSDWRFLTAADAAGIEPVLAAFDQDALRLHAAGAQGEPDRATPLIQHVLKVFLVDAEGRVRNIYGAGLFSRELVLADVKTLLLETGGLPPAEQGR